MEIFHIGEKVVHSPEGVCRIAEICQLEVNKTKRFYYKLQPLKEQRKAVYIPVDSAGSRVRPLKTREEIIKILLIEPEDDLLQRENPHKKMLLQTHALLRDDSELLIRLIKFYRRKHREKRLSQGDYRWLRDAESYLFTEIAEVLECDYTSLLQEISGRHLYRCA